MTRTCPSCGTTLSSDYRYCLNCGRDCGAVTLPVEEPPPTLVYQGAPPTSPKKPELQTASTPKKSIVPWLLLGGCLIIIGFLAGLLLLGPFKRNEVTTNQVAAGPTVTPTPDVTSTPSVGLNNNPSNTNTLQSLATPTPQNENSNSKPAPSPTPSPKDENRVYTANEVDQPAKILSKPAATYTEEARANNVTGMVVLRVVLEADGSVSRVRMVKGLPHGLTEQAIAAAKQLKFTRAIKDGREVSMYMQVEYAFYLY